MKKILTAIALIACLVLPLSAMSMTAIGDNEMSAITGQAGVSIGADLTTKLTAGTIAWGDNDGAAAVAGSTAGWVGIKDLAIDNMRMHMRSDMGMIDRTAAAAAYTGILGGTLAELAAEVPATPSVRMQKAILLSILTTNQLLTIDVYTAGGNSAVRIGLPTFEINMATMDAKAGLWSTVTNNATFQELGTIYVQNMTALIGKNNYVDISKNETTSGVLINVGNTGTGNMVDSLTIAALSWGDSDGTGAAAGSLAGYVGLTDLAVSNIKVAATMSINVATAGLGAVPTLLAMNQAELLAYQGALPGLLAAGDMGVKNLLGYILHANGIVGSTAVDIAMTANVNIGSVAATVALGSTKNLAGAVANQNVMGQLYISNLGLVVPSYGAGYAASWVSISAH